MSNFKTNVNVLMKSAEFINKPPNEVFCMQGAAIQFSENKTFVEIIKSVVMVKMFAAVCTL